MLLDAPGFLPECVEQYAFDETFRLGREESIELVRAKEQARLPAFFRIAFGSKNLLQTAVTTRNMEEREEEELRFFEDHGGLYFSSLFVVRVVMVYFRGRFGFG